MKLVYEFYEHPSEQVLDHMAKLDKVIFNPCYTREKLKRDSSAKRAFSIFLCRDGDKILGYKTGYEMTSRLYYSWIGGVIPEARGQGIALELMKRQHAFASEKGYKCVRTHTKNKFRNMLLLNIKNGFDVVGVCMSEHDDMQTIMLEKSLKC